MLSPQQSQAPRSASNAETWGEGTVDQLAAYIAEHHPELRGFTRRNLYRMRQFYETYRNDEKLSTPVRESPWTHNTIILSKCFRPEEREFYVRVVQRERWNKRRLEKEIDGALFERKVLSPPIVLPVVAQLHPTAPEVFRDSYVLDFLDLPEPHSENDLQRGLVGDMRRFLQALGHPINNLTDADRCERYVAATRAREALLITTAAVTSGAGVTDSIETKE